MNQKLNIAICSYRSAPFGGGQGIFIYELSKALQALGHNVDVISGPPYPNLEAGINLIKSPGLDLFSTFVFKERLSLFKKKRINLQMIGMNFFRHFLGGFPEIKDFWNRAKQVSETTFL